MVPTPRKPKSLDAESQLSPVDRTPRAKAKKIESYQENEESESDLEYPVKKKPRSSKKGAQLKVGKPGKRRRLSLAMLFELLPLELVFEIWSYLEPLDLLRISRSNKWLQDLLTSKTSVAVWRTARANVTPPLDCPPDQTEVQWASLVFENNCSLCGAPSTTTVYWALRIRACGSCRIAHLTSARAAQKRLSHVQDVETVLELVPKSRDFGARSYVAGQRYVYDIRAIEAVGEQLEGLELRIEAKLAHSHEELEAYKSAQKQIVAEITYHGQKAKEWERLWLESRREQKEEIASQRKTDVQKRLLELGHDPKDVSRALSCPSVDKPKPLTENGWRAIRGTVENLVNQHKTTRLEYERRETLRRRQTKFSSVYFQFRQRTGLPPVGFAPGISDLCQLPEISSILEQENDVEVTEESFAPVLSLLPQYLDQWTRKKQELLLLKMAEAGIGGISEPPTDSNCQLLRKASSVFFCDRVKSSRRYVRRVPDDRDMAPIPPDDSMYWHLCITKESGYGRFIHRDEPDWSLSCLIFDKDVMERIDALVETLGLDPCETTASDLDALNARVICIDCDILKNDTAWSWRAAARHIRDHKSSGITWNGWRRLSQVEERAQSICAQTITRRWKKRTSAQIPPYTHLPYP
ncbi:hypothetical protein FRC02_011197 [Tulasnella sp. 418]|nr:hypothetical protein FRC02_011197 [Tulasnella sp. 418]